MMLFTALDLEMNQPSGKIIQVGACVGDLDSGAILRRFNQIVSLDEPLNPFITQLTGITEERIAAEGQPLIGVYGALKKFHEQSFMNPITWGGGDSVELLKQLGADTGGWPFGRRWIDCKTLFIARQLARGEKMQSGLAKAMTKCGLRFEGKKHDAADDAANTWRLFVRLVKDLK
jgi:DNA polymerase III alpha subunit (gram-positive type)